MEKSGWNSSRIISLTPLHLNLMLEWTTVYTSNWKGMNMEMNITVISFYMWTMCCVSTRIQKKTKLGWHIFPLQGSHSVTQEVPRAYTSKFVIPKNLNVVTFWSISADVNVKKALQVIEAKLKWDNIRWKPSNKTVDHPFSRKFDRPELDITKEINDDQVNFYQSLVGIMRWLCWIGMIDILTETSLLLMYPSAPRVGHLH